MVSWDGIVVRHLVTFWFSDLSYWKEDQDEVERFCNGKNFAGRNAKICLKKIFFGAFITDVSKADWARKNQGYFGMSVLKIQDMG